MKLHFLENLSKQRRKIHLPVLPPSVARVFKIQLPAHVSTKLKSLGFFAFCAVVLLVMVHGIAGNPTSKDLNQLKWKDNGPLELSPDRGRFALTYSLLEDHSFQFSNAIAHFAAPDVATIHGAYVSLFAPTVSYIVMPGYILGKHFGISQVGTFAVIAVFALLNVGLIRAIAIRLGAHPIAAMVSALIFLFATPAFPYAVTLYQHHISTFLILICFYVLLKFNNIWSLAVVWFCCALSISVDNPNLFFMFPIGLFALGRLLHVEESVKNIKVSINLRGIVSMAIMIIPIAFFLYFNKQSYGNPFQLAGTVASADIKDAPVDLQVIGDKQLAKSQAKQIPPVNPSQKEALLFFRTRNLPNGFYEHFLSQDRGMITFTPIMFFGIIGIYIFVRQKGKFTQLLLAVMGANILLYSMWGDPYGGWAFGSRYLIPTYAILALFISVALTKLRRNMIFLIIFFGFVIYSVSVNTIGAATSNSSPPKAEVLALEALSGIRQRYSFTRDMVALDHNASKSFIYQDTAIHSVFSAWQFTRMIIVAILSVIGLSLLSLYRRKETV